MAILAAYNERRFIAGCLENLYRHGVYAYLIDNESTDDTIAIAERHRGRGLIGIEQFPRNGTYNWRGLLRRKEQLAMELDADWFMHVDPDELRLPPRGMGTLAEALAVVDADGYNAVNFIEFTFVPTREHPDHDHPKFQCTLNTYYPFSPVFPHQLKAWKSVAAPRPELVSTGGHKVDFPDVRIYPASFPTKHYLFLSVPHAIEKYVDRGYDAAEVESGWHGWRARITADDLSLPAEATMRHTRTDADLDHSNPRQRHYIDDAPVGQ